MLIASAFPVLSHGQFPQKLVNARTVSHGYAAPGSFAQSEPVAASTDVLDLSVLAQLLLNRLGDGLPAERSYKHLTRELRNAGINPEQLATHQYE